MLISTQNSYAVTENGMKRHDFWLAAAHQTCCFDHNCDPFLVMWWKVLKGKLAHVALGSPCNHFVVVLMRFSRIHHLLNFCTKIIKTLFSWRVQINTGCTVNKFNDMYLKSIEIVSLFVFCWIRENWISLQGCNPSPKDIGYE